MSGLPTAQSIDNNARVSPKMESHFDYSKPQNEYEGDYKTYGERGGHTFFQKRENRSTPNGIKNPVEVNPGDLPNDYGPNNPPQYDPNNPQEWLDWYATYGSQGGGTGGLGLGADFYDQFGLGLNGYY